jgi:hypothetical protein
MSERSSNIDYVFPYTVYYSFTVCYYFCDSIWAQPHFFSHIFNKRSLRAPPDNLAFTKHTANPAVAIYTRPVLIHLVLFSLLEHGSHHRHLLVIYMIVNSLPTHQLHDTSPRGVRRIQLTSIISMDRKNLSSISTGPQKLLISPMLVAFTVLPPTYFIILIAILRSSYYLNSVLACF